MAERWAYVHPSMHDNPKLRGLSDSAWRLLSYLLTAEREFKTPGVILGRLGHHSDRLNRPSSWIRKHLAELVAACVNIKADLEAGLIWMPNGVGKYQPCSNSAIAKGWSDEWWKVPACPLREELRVALREAVAAFEGHSINGRGNLPSPSEMFVDAPPPSPAARSAAASCRIETAEPRPPTRPPTRPSTRPSVPQVSGIRDHRSGETQTRADPPDAESPGRLSAEATPGTGKAPLVALKPPTPVPTGDRRAAARRRIWLAHLARFNAMAAEFGGGVPEMADRFRNEAEELISAYLVDCGEAIDAGEFALMHSLDVAEAEARRTRSLDFFGQRMWTNAAIETRATRKISDARTGPRGHANQPPAPAPRIFKKVT